MHLRDSILWIEFGIVKVLHLVVPAMPSENQNQSKTHPLLPSNVLLSLATAPVLVGLWGVRQVGNWLEDLSDLSEEIWRGDRLPVLHFPVEEEEQES